MLKSQVLEEVLRERAQFCFSKFTSLDFWLTISPKFLLSNQIDNKIKSTTFYKNYLIHKNKSPNFCSLITSNKEFIIWIKLRLGYFEDINKIENFKNETITIDGIYGELNQKDFEFESLLLNDPNKLSEELLLERYKNSIKLSSLI
jgi:hypothetical protein